MATPNVPDFDPVKYYLGILCKRGHDWHGTGQTLRWVKGGDCPACRKAYYYENHEAQKALKRADHQRNKEKDNQRSREHRLKNLEKYRAYDKYRKQRDREKIAPRRHQHYLENKKRLNAYRAQWYQRNRDSILVLGRKHRLENPELVAQRKKAYYQSPLGKLTARRSGDNRRAKKRKVHSLNYTSTQAQELVECFGGACAYCGIDFTTGKMHLDHFIAISKGGPNVIGNLIPCCSSCNISKRNLDPKDWYQSQQFYSKRRWSKILKVLGKTDDNYSQIPLL